MWIDQHPFLFIYLLGCVFVVILLIFKFILFSSIGWITKANIYKKNLEKTLPPDEKTFGEKAILSFVTLILEAALSWVNVIAQVWQIITVLLKELREVFVSTPEDIKLLPFPLKNNSHMSREAAQAYFHAILIKAGEKLPNESELVSSLNELFEYYPHFNKKEALDQLKSLNVIDVDVISSALNNLYSLDEET